MNVGILEKLVALNFKREYVIKCINGNKHNHVTTSYYLLLKKAEKAGEIEDGQFQIFDEKKLQQIAASSDKRTLQQETTVLLPPANDNLNKT